MRTIAPIAAARALGPSWANEDDDTLNRMRAVVAQAIDEIDLPDDTPDDTVKIIRQPDEF